MASCMECIHFNPCNMHGNIIVEKPTKGNDWGLHNEVEKECKYFTPTADVAEVKHGRWKGAGMGDYYCSLCQEVVSGSDFKYCPNCGAKMDGQL